MSWLDIFKRKPRVPGSAVGVSFEDDAPTPGKIAYTAEEVAGAGVSKAEVEELLVDIIAKSYIAARNGRASITMTHDNILALHMAAKDLKRSGYKVSVYPSGVVPLPYITVSWM